MLTRFSQGNNVLGSPASIIDFLTRDIVLLIHLNGAILHIGDVPQTLKP
jgi:hypothetical protein